MITAAEGARVAMAVPSLEENGPQYARHHPGGGGTDVVLRAVHSKVTYSHHLTRDESLP